MGLRRRCGCSPQPVSSCRRTCSGRDDRAGCDRGTGGAGSFVAQDFNLDGGGRGVGAASVGARALPRFLNGQRVGDDLLTPGWTCYDDRIAYQTYDVAALLKPGRTGSRSGWATAGSARR